MCLARSFIKDLEHHILTECNPNVTGSQRLTQLEVEDLESIGWIAEGHGVEYPGHTPGEKCTICKNPMHVVMYDAYVPKARWMPICGECFMLHGCRLGIGCGQKYIAHGGVFIKERAIGADAIFASTYHFE